MIDIFHYFYINASVTDVFKTISTAEGLERWWSEKAVGNPLLGEHYKLSFGAAYNWTTVVSKLIPNKEFELTITEANEDWIHTKVGFVLSTRDNTTYVRFYHKNWKESNEHYRISCYCWAMYLRVLKRYLEFGEQVPYKDRLNV